MTDISSTSAQPAPEKSGFIQRIRHGIAYLKANKKRLFWWWISYHVIKGCLTTALIWIPALYLWLGH